MGLFSPIWMTKDTSKIKKAEKEILKITDIDKLKEIAIKAPLAEVKCRAIFNIEDENVLKEIYLNKDIELSHFQVFALSKIYNKEILEEIAIKEAEDNYYYCAFNKISNEKLLNKLILDKKFEITETNFGYDLVLKAIHTIDNNKDIDNIINKYSKYIGIVRFANNQKDKINGIKAYIGICPTCHKDIIYDIYWDFYDEKQREKSHFICGCNKFTINSFKDDCEIKKVKKEPEGNYINFCFNCGLPIESSCGGYKKCTCNLRNKYIPISVKLQKEKW